jgi:hypothetical protein
MPTSPNFLLGYGERLTEPVAAPPRPSTKLLPYSFVEARSRVIPMVQATVKELTKLPALACPNGQAVTVLTLHPEYLAKSYFPAALFRSVGLDSVGSRPSKVTPQKWTRKSAPELTETTDLFLAGARDALRQWSESLPFWNEQTPGGNDLVSVEQFRPQRVEDRLKPIQSTNRELTLEIVLHASANRSSSFILEGFEGFLKVLNLKANFDRRFYVGGLCFLPMQAPRAILSKIAEFSFLRVLREMPRLRTLNPIVRSVPIAGFDCPLPNSLATNSTARVAIFDGGIAKKSPLTKWVQPIDSPGIGNAVTEYLNHGHQVTSAFLFGSLKRGEQPFPPFTGADHYRVLDDTSANDPLELYDVLERIRKVLDSSSYEFINLSIGPELPVEDKDVHGWTAFFDEYLSGGNTLAAIAVGNGGELDRQTGNARIQVPSDCVNGLSIGASDSCTDNWQRASYSSIGPGRSPGVVKPDILAFGGSDNEPFWVVDSATPTRTSGTMGTSFATPAALRLGLGVRAYLGQVITPLAIKALLVHCANDNKNDRIQNGWGRVPQTLEELIECPDASARILYQGELSPAQYLRAQVPVPKEGMSGLVAIRATFCYATRTDPQDPGNYTRSGLDVVFRPHDGKPIDGVVHPKPSPFFQLKEFSVEQELRRDAHKWETTLHRERRMQSTGLRNPVFDIHYNAREGGARASTPPKIRYALVVSVTAPKTPDLYNKIVRRYATQLRPLQPVIALPIRT